MLLLLLRRQLLLLAADAADLPGCHMLFCRCCGLMSERLAAWRVPLTLHHA